VNRETADILAESLAVPPEHILEIDADRVAAEIVMCDECKDFTSTYIERMQVIMADEEISLSIRLSYMITTSAIVLARTSHGEALPSDVMKGLGMHFEMMETAAMAQERFAEIFNLMFPGGSGDPTDPRNN
jgi:hypothetical protein